jgi:hypothetical protein
MQLQIQGFTALQEFQLGNTLSFCCKHYDVCIDGIVFEESRDKNITLSSDDEEKDQFSGFTAAIIHVANEVWQDQKADMPVRLLYDNMHCLTSVSKIASASGIKSTSDRLAEIWQIDRRAVFAQMVRDKKKDGKFLSDRKPVNTAPKKLAVFNKVA